MSEIQSQCPICDESNVERQRDGSRDVFIVQCPRCGRFGITRTLLQVFSGQEDRSLLPYLSAHTRQASEQGNCVELNSYDWEEFAERHRRSGVARKIGLALEWVTSESTAIGDEVFVNNALNYPLFDAQSGVEADRLFDYLEDSGLIKATVRTMGARKIELTMHGWQHLEEEAERAAGGKNCFVAMWFDDDMFKVYDEAIDPAIRASGFVPRLANRIQHNDDICDRVIAEIRRSKFVVADFTGHRGGAYFEAGFAMGLGRPVIFTCRKDDMEKAHFDTNHYNHITWEDAGDLRIQLEERITATIVD